MQNILSIERFKGTSDLGKYLDRLLFGQSFLALDILGKRAAVTKLIDEIVVVGGPQHFNELDDVGVVDFGEDGDLVVGEL